MDGLDTKCCLLFVLPVQLGLLLRPPIDDGPSQSQPLPFEVLGPKGAGVAPAAVLRLRPPLLPQYLLQAAHRLLGQLLPGRPLLIDGLDMKCRRILVLSVLLGWLLRLLSLQLPQLQLLPR